MNRDMSKINRVVLVGNGFDLAHGLKTRYEDLIDWYFYRCYENLKKYYMNQYTDGLTTFTLMDRDST
jgi:hypothetical protein